MFSTEQPLQQALANPPLNRECSDVDPIVIDTGSDTFKAGFAGDDGPRVVFPSVIGRSRGRAYMKEMYAPWVGDEAQSKRSMVDMSYPVQKGIVTDWEDMELLLHHTYYNELRSAPEEHNLVITEPPNNPKESREKLTQIMFETFNVPAMYLALQQTLSLYASGRITGVVVDLGYETTHVVPINNGYAYPHCLGNRQPVGGRHVTKYLTKILNEGEESNLEQCMTPISERTTARHIKEKHCYVTLDVEKETQNFTDDAKKPYELPDGEVITISNEMFRAPEVLFKPSLIDVDCHGIHESIFDCVNNKIDVKERLKLYSNIVLSGGTSMFPGLRERLQTDVTALAPATIIRDPTSVKVVAPPKRLHSTWIGGSILASVVSFPPFLMTKEEYNESGPSLVHKKFV